MSQKSIDRLSFEDWDNLVSSIYEAALQPQLWDQVMSAIGQPLNAHAGHLVMLSGNGTYTHCNKTIGLDPVINDQVMAYVEKGLHTRINAGQHAPPMTLLNDHMHSSEKQMKQDPIYQGPFKEHDIEYYGGFVLSHAPGCFTGLATLRSRRFGHFSDRETALLARLMPHLKRSIDLMQQLPMQGLLTGLNQSLEYHPSGAVIIGHRGTIVGMNTKARAILKLEDGVFEREKALQVTHVQAQKQLRQEIKKIIDPGDYLDLQGAGYIRVPRTTSSSPYILFTTPIRKSEDPFRQIAGIVFIMDPDEQMPELKTQLIKIYGLTRAEAELVQALCEGKTLAEIAQEQRISIDAPRFHLKNVFSKIGVKRQPELIRTVLRGLATVNS